MRLAITPSAAVTVLLLLLLASTARAGDMPTAADVTERGRSVAVILDMVLAPPRATGPEGRTLVFLVDVSASLQKSKFAGELRAALARNARHLEGTRIGIARAGAKEALVLAPTADRELVAKTMAEVCAEVDTAFQDVYADVRRVVPALRRFKGSREVLLVTLENGDAEKDVERAVTELRRADVRLSVVAREAFLSDTYWVLRPPQGPPGTNFTGSDGAFVDLPWGVRFQWAVPNNWILSGFAMYGLTRLAAATDGKVFLYYPSTGIGHVCRAHYHSTCLFCNEDHHPEGEVYQPHRLRALSPLAGSRTDVISDAAADPFYKAVLRAWDVASRLNLVYSRPSLERTGGQVRIDPYPYKGWIPLGSTVALSGERARAGRLVQACDRVLRELNDALGKGEAEKGRERYRAIADTTRLMFEVTRLNLLLYIAYCEEVGPLQMRRRAAEYEAPEVAPHGDDVRFLYIGYWNLSLCHGVAPFRAVRLPGGAEMQAELEALRASWDAFQDRWGHTPYARAVRRLGLAQFFLVVRPGYVPPGKRRVPDTPSEGTVTLPERPARPARPGSGTSAGDTPTTGGG